MRLPPTNELLAAAAPLLPIIILMAIFGVGPPLIRHVEQLAGETSATWHQHVEQLHAFHRIQTRLLLLLVPFGLLALIAAVATNPVALITIGLSAAGAWFILNGVTMVYTRIGEYRTMLRHHVFSGNAARVMGLVYMAIGLPIMLVFGSIGLLALAGR